MYQFPVGLIYACIIAVAFLAPVESAEAPDIWSVLETGDVEEIKRLLTETPEFVNYKNDETGFTPLHEAAAKGQTVICKLLIERGANIHAGDRMGNSPLHTASFNGHAPVVRLLVERGADINRGGQEGGTVVHMAAWGGHPQLIKRFVDMGADVNATDDNGYTPAVWAAAGTETTALDALVRLGADLTAPIRMGRSMLHLAAGNGGEAVVNYLLDRGLDVNAKSDYGNTPVFWAVRSRNYGVVEVLAARGADLGVTNSMGHTPVSFAVCNNATEAVKIFADNGAPVIEQDDAGDTYLHAAAYHGFLEAAEFLLARGVDPNAVNKQNDTALSLAVERGHEDMKKLLVASGATQNTTVAAREEGQADFRRAGSGPATPVKFTIVYDNYAYKKGMEAGYGFSCYVEGPEKNVLFDTGTESELFERNLKALEINPEDVDVVVISHEHGDHTGGLWTLLKRNSGVRVVVPNSASYTFVRKIESYGTVVLQAKKPTEICEAVFVGGEIGGPIKEQSLAVDTPEGPVVVCGCSHPGIVETVEYFKNITGRNVYMTVGGFHLMNATQEETVSIIDRLQDLGVARCGPAHCTGQRQIQTFKREFGGGHVDTGVGCVIVVE